MASTRLSPPRSSATVRAFCRTEHPPPLLALHQERLITDRARLLDLRRPVVMPRAYLPKAVALFRAVLLLKSPRLDEDPTADRAGLFSVSLRLPIGMGCTAASVDEAVLFMRQHLQVFRAIVVALVVAVMDLLLLSKRPTEHLAGDQPMLQDIACLHRVRMLRLLQQHIAIASRKSTSNPSWILGTNQARRRHSRHRPGVYL